MNRSRPLPMTSEPLSHAASSTESSLARIPPILLKAGIWMPYFSSSLLMLLISSSGRQIHTDCIENYGAIEYSIVKAKILKYTAWNTISCPFTFFPSCFGTIIDWKSWFSKHLHTQSMCMYNYFQMIQWCSELDSVI